MQSISGSILNSEGGSPNVILYFVVFYYYSKRHLNNSVK